MTGLERRWALAACLGVSMACRGNVPADADEKPPAVAARPPATPEAPLASPLPGEDGRVPETVTYTEHVAPLIYGRCAICHRPGQSAPFSLLTEDDARDHGEQIADVTASRFMPPWKPIRGHGTFRGDRSLNDAQIAIFSAWVEGGMRRGPEQARPPQPTFPTGWLAGTPDVILTVDGTYTTPAEGLDVYVNFVLSSPLDRPVWVDAWELDPGSAAIAHHAILSLDRGGWARRKEAETPGTGFESMTLDSAQSPGGRYLVWAPGSMPDLDSAQYAWPLRAGADVILQVHIQPTGKPETLQPRIGLHLSDEPPQQQGMVLRVGDAPIDIPAGEAAYEMRDTLKLTAEASVRSVFPHAHFLARRFDCNAKLPDGTTVPLLRIDDWDFSWQDQYRYATPVRLPAGTEIDLRITYDNSSANPRNPNVPPQRVLTGPRSTDEMGNVTFEVIPRDHEASLALREVKFRRALGFASTAKAHYNLANTLWQRGKKDEAESHFRRALEEDPDHVWSLHNLSMLLLERGQADEAVALAQREVALAPNAATAHNNLGNALRGAQDREAAIAAFRKAMALDPEDRASANSLALMGAAP